MMGKRKGNTHRFSRIVAIVAALVAVTSFLSFGMAGQARANDSIQESLLAKEWSLRGGAFFSFIDSEVRLDKRVGGLGATIDFEDLVLNPTTDPH